MLRVVIVYIGRYMADIHQAFRVALAKKNTSQSEISRQVGKSRFHISNICNENSTPSWELISDVCEALDIPASEFIKGGE